MRLHRKLVRVSKATGKRFYRYDLSIPSRNIEELGWTKETALAARVRGDELVIRAKR